MMGKLLSLQPCAKLLATIILLTLSSLHSALATPLTSDKLVWYGDEFLLKKESGLNLDLLEPYFEIHPNKRPEPQLTSSANRRGYIATFELRYHDLHIKDIEVLQMNPTNKQSDWPSVNRISIIDTVFPKGEKTLADWFSGIIVLKKALSPSPTNDLDYSKPANRKYKEYSVVEIFKGQIIDIRAYLKPTEFQELKEKQFKYFKTTDAFATLKEQQFLQSQHLTGSSKPAASPDIELTMRDQIFDHTSALYDKKEYQDNFPLSYMMKELEQQPKTETVDLMRLQVGEALRMYHGGHFVIVYKRTTKDNEYLKKKIQWSLADPDSENFKAALASNLNDTSTIRLKKLLTDFQPSIDRQPWRSLNDDYFVFARRSPHSNCNIELVREDKSPLKRFYDPCTNVYFDAAGKVVIGNLKSAHPKRLNARFNLFIPPHHFTDKNSIKFDLASKEASPKKQEAPEQDYANLSNNEKLILAASYNDTLVVKEALAGGADVNYVNTDNKTAIGASVAGASIDLVSFLLKEGAIPNWGDFELAGTLRRNDVQKLILSNR